MTESAIRLFGNDTNSVPDTITDRQFGQGLWMDGLISFSECQAFVATGVIPAELQALIDQLPDDDSGNPTPRKEAIILVSGSKEYQRYNPLVEQIGAAYGWDAATIDAKWQAWSLL